MDNSNNNIPHTVFIIPYRDREKDKKRVVTYFNLLKTINNWSDNSALLFFSHQDNKALFNRGAVKNIGFKAIKELFPQHYKDITFVFHDVDIIPNNPKEFDYKTTHGVVKHYYGYEYTLGGVFAIKGLDFEKTGGFPNFWGWGFEDNCIYDRCINNNIKIDRSVFYKINDKKITHNIGSHMRLTSKREANIYKNEQPDNMYDLFDIEYYIKDNFINIKNFKTNRKVYKNEFYYYDIRKGSKITIPSGWFRRKWNLF